MSATKPEDRGEALHKAKEAFEEAAAAYCGTQRCGDNETCTSSVKIASTEDLGIVSTPVPGSSQVRCSIKFKVVGSITCTCKSR